MRSSLQGSPGLNLAVQQHRLVTMLNVIVHLECAFRNHEIARSRHSLKELLVIVELWQVRIFMPNLLPLMSECRLAMLR